MVSCPPILLRLQTPTKRLAPVLDGSRHLGGRARIKDLDCGASSHPSQTATCYRLLALKEQQSGEVAPMPAWPRTSSAAAVVDDIVFEPALLNWLDVSRKTL